MKLATTTSDLDRVADLPTAIRAMAAAGFRHIDLSLYTIDRSPSPFMSDDWEAYTDELFALAEDLHVDFVQCHTPGSFNPFSEGETFDRLCAATIRSLEVSARLGIPHAVIHTGWAPGMTRAECFARNQAFLSRFFSTMERTGVFLLTENSTRINMGDQYHFYDGETMATFLDEMDHPLLGACWDVGHAHLEGHNAPDIQALGPRLRALHIHDNRSGSDEHLLPFAGHINMDEVLTALSSVGYSGYFTFECDSLFSPASARRPADVPARLAGPSFSMMVAAERLICETGKYLLETYGLFDES